MKRNTDKFNKTVSNRNLKGFNSKMNTKSTFEFTKTMSTFQTRNEKERYLNTATTFFPTRKNFYAETATYKFTSSHSYDDNLRSSYNVFLRYYDMSKAVRTKNQYLELQRSEYMELQENLKCVQNILKNKGEEKEHVMELLRLIYHMESEQDIMLMLKEGSFTNMLMSQNVSIKDIITKTILYHYKASVWGYEEDMINAVLQNKVVKKVITFYQNNADPIKQAIQLKQDNDEIINDIFDLTLDIEYLIDKLIWRDAHIRDTYMAIMKINYNGLEDKKNYYKNKMKFIEDVNIKLKKDIQILDERLYLAHNMPPDYWDQKEDEKKKIEAENIRLREIQMEAKRAYEKMHQEFIGLRDHFSSRKTLLNDSLQQNYKFIELSQGRNSIIQEHRDELDLKSDYAKYIKNFDTKYNEFKEKEDNILAKYEERRQNIVNAQDDCQNRGVNTIYNQDIFNRYLETAKDIMVKNENTITTKFNIYKKIELSNILLLNLEINNFDPNEVPNLISNKNSKTINDRELYSILLMNPFNIKDSELMFDICSYLTKNSLQVIHGKINDISEENVYDVNLVIARVVKLLNYSDYDMILDESSENKINEILYSIFKSHGEYLKTVLYISDSFEQPSEITALQNALSKLDSGFDQPKLTKSCLDYIQLIVFKFNRLVDMQKSVYSIKYVKYTKFLKWYLSSAFKGNFGYTHKLSKKNNRDDLELYYENRKTKKDLTKRKLLELYNKQRTLNQFIDDKLDISITISEDSTVTRGN